MCIRDRQRSRRRVHQERLPGPRADQAPGDLGGLLFALANRTWAAAALVCAVGCNGDIADGPKADPKEMAGAGGRDIAEYWPSLDIPLSQNTRMLSAEMLKAEVMRATGRSWVVMGVDQWDRNRGPLG